MTRRQQSVIIIISAILVTAKAQSQTALPDGEGKDLTMQVCTKCHGIDVITSHRLSKTQWNSEVNTMASRGASATDPEFDKIVEYLAKNFGNDAPADAASTKDEAKSNGNTASAVQNEAPADAASTENETKLNVNTASAAQLEKFLGLTVSEATAVVQYRKENGDYKDLSDLEKVPDLDIKKFSDKKDRLIF